MQFKSLVLAALAAVSATAQLQAPLNDACAAGAILGIYALCGTRPVDCGSSKCCLEGQKCVQASGGFKCADSALVKGATVTVNAACYGTATASKSASASASKSAFASASASASATASHSGKPSGSGAVVPSQTGSGSASPSASGPAQGAGGNGGPKPSNGPTSPPPFTNTAAGSGGVAPSSTTSRSPVLATANAALSYSSPNSNLAALLPAMGLVAYLL